MNRFKFCVFVLLFAVAGCYAPPNPPAKATGTTTAISYATFERFTENDFKRISEYFTDRENQGDNLILRTNSKKRAGAYLTIGLENGARVPAGTTIELFYCVPAKSGYFQQTWKTERDFVALPEREILLGVTDHGNALPNAWRFVITAPDGTIIAARSSFLWGEYNGIKN